VIVDTSALVAIALQEPSYETLIETLADPAAIAGIGSPTVAELGLVLSARLAIDARSLISSLLEQFEISVVPRPWLPAQPGIVVVVVVLPATDGGTVMTVTGAEPSALRITNTCAGAFTTPVEVTALT
jgi:hypothetical protein